MAGGQILAFSIDIDRRPYNTLALPCECVMNAGVFKEGNYYILSLFILKDRLNPFPGWRS